MSASQVYPAMSGSITPEQLCGDVDSGIVSTDWYTPSTYAYDQAYMTPFPSTTVEPQPWTQYARASIPDISLTNYQLHQTPSLCPPSLASVPPPRPQSSPSTFGPSPESINWNTTAGLGIQYSCANAQPTPVTSTFPPSSFSMYPAEDQYTATSSPPTLAQPMPRRPFQQIAPNPAGVIAQAIKRRRDEEDGVTSDGSGKKRRRTNSVSTELSDDDKFLVQLKETESLPWKDIVTRFQTDKGKSFQVAALQMRYKRLREKFRVWGEVDLQALRQAHEFYEKCKWEIISTKMLEFGVSERWPARHCARKYQEMDMYPMSTYPMATSGITPAVSQYSSPVEAPMHYAWMPIQ